MMLEGAVNCRCGHPKELHLDGVCIGDCGGDVCDCMAFRKAGTRDKWGKSKRQDCLDRWHGSINAPLGNDRQGAEFSTLIGGEDRSLAEARSGEQGEEEYAAELDREMRARYAKGRIRRARRHVERDMLIYDGRRAGRTMQSLADQFNLSQARICLILNDIAAFETQILFDRMLARKQQPATK